MMAEPSFQLLSLASWIILMPSLFFSLLFSFQSILYQYFQDAHLILLFFALCPLGSFEQGHLEYEVAKVGYNSSEEVTPGAEVIADGGDHKQACSLGGSCAKARL